MSKYTRKRYGAVSTNPVNTYTFPTKTDQKPPISTIPTAILGSCLL